MSDFWDESTCSTLLFYCSLYFLFAMSVVQFTTNKNEITKLRSELVCWGQQKINKHFHFVNKSVQMFFLMFQIRKGDNISRAESVVHLTFWLMSVCKTVQILDRFMSSVWNLRKYSKSLISLLHKRNQFWSKLQHPMCTNKCSILWTPT